MVESILQACLFAAFVMLLLSRYAERRGEADVVDCGWAFLVGISGVWFCVSLGLGERALLGAGMIGFWSIRLGGYLLRHRVFEHGEDGRYLALRQRWGKDSRRNFRIFFQAQALLAVAFALPLIAVATSSESPLGWLDFVGVAVFGLALFGEALADRQLAAHRRDPRNRGRTCRSGLWRFSRHPNYFFEWLHWLSYPCLGWTSTWWLLGMGTPILLYFLLMKVTGIPPTEARALESRGDDYREYQRTTSPFFPWFPRD